MFAFVLYALGVWYAAARYRRTLAGFLWVGAGLLGLVVISLGHYGLFVYTKGAVNLPVLGSLLWPFAVLVVGVGLYIAALPRPKVLCERCGTDLTQGRHEALPVCPCCGLRRSYRAHGRACAMCKYDLSGMDEDAGICPECGVRYTHRRMGPPAPTRPVRGPVGPEPVPGVEREGRRRRLLRGLSRAGS